MAKNSQVMGKEKSEKGNSFAQGGKTKMFGPQSADPALPGTSSVNAGSANNKFGIAPGTGKGHMAKPQGALPSLVGTSSPNAGSPDNKFGVKGGTTKMFGKQTATVAQPGTSSVRNG